MIMGYLALFILLWLPVLLVPNRFKGDVASLIFNIILTAVVWFTMGAMCFLLLGAGLDTGFKFTSLPGTMWIIDNLGWDGETRLLVMVLKMPYIILLLAFTIPFEAFFFTNSILMKIAGVGCISFIVWAWYAMRMAAHEEVARNEDYRLAKIRINNMHGGIK